MKIKLDKKIGDEVWLMSDDRVVSGNISDIYYREFISNLDHETVIKVERYVVITKDNRYDSGLKKINCLKEDLFPDKESLIKSL